MSRGPRARKQRTGVHVEASTPALYRRLIALAVPYVVTRAEDGSLTILDEERWSAMLGAFEAREVTP
jgi:hypothetical protein